MSKKNLKPSAAENLIESLMDDLKDIKKSDELEGLPLSDDDANRVENTLMRNNVVWDNLASDIDSSEYTGGVSESSEEEKSEDFEVPEGFGELPPSENFLNNSSTEESFYKGPSMDGGYQSVDDLEDFKPPPFKDSARDLAYGDAGDATRPVDLAGSSGGEDKTVSIQQDINGASTAGGGDADKTVAVEGFANARLGKRRPEVDVKVSVGNFRGGRGSANVMTSVDASLAQSENLKFAQQRILELEKEVEFLRSENEELASAGEIIRSRTDDLGVRITTLEKEKTEMQESAHSEILILKGNLQYRENEAAKARLKVEELETRLKSDFKKIRVRERELENRLELLRAEKSALVRSKDEYILEQKRKIDQLSQELDNYRKKCLELNKMIESNQDQVKRTERALRLALSNLEAKEENFVPLKKAE